MVFNCGVGEDSWESLARRSNQSILKEISPECWCKELTHLERPWSWERLRAGGEGGNRGWDGWMVSPTWWTWVWVASGSWWWTGRPGVLQFMGSQRVGHDWATELNWKLFMLFHLFFQLFIYMHMYCHVYIYFILWVKLFSFILLLKLSLILPLGAYSTFVSFRYVSITSSPSWLSSTTRPILSFLTWLCNQPFIQRSVVF